MNKGTMGVIIPGHWLATKDGDRAALYLYRRHYSFHHYRDHRRHVLFVGPGKKLVYVTQNYDALFVWRKFIDDSGEKGVNCSVFRNESSIRSSDLIREACALAWRKWPGERLYTYVDPTKTKTGNPKTGKPFPGKCFIKAGWNLVMEKDQDGNPIPKRTKSGKLILENFERKTQ